MSNRAPFLALIGHGTLGNDGIESGIHLRWAFPWVGAHFKKVGRYNHKITSLDKPQKLVYYNPGLE